ncbi:MgtC/SapB family protein [Haloferula sargassicola]|uniref:Protein SrpB n=1 Tax=Haloferula sargassicola TaxID=490096 RepID=A0ABP9UNJ9_9BACT
MTGDLDGLSALWHLAVAFAFSLPTAWNRERANRTAGLRTFPLVSMTSCGFMLVAIPVLGEHGDHARTIGGIMSGLGFLGGGAILKNEEYAMGLATAAAIWLTGALGLAVAYNRFDVASILSVASFLTLYFGDRAKGHFGLPERTDE